MNRPSICNSCGNLMGVSDKCPYCGASRNSALGFLKQTARSLERGDSFGIVTNYLLIFTIGVYFIQVFFGVYAAGSSSVFSILWKGPPGHVHWLTGAATPDTLTGSYYTLITASFLHGGIFHLGMNMYALKQIGPLIERMVGPFLYIPVYLICGAVGFFASMYSASVAGRLGISVGASAGLFGFIAFGSIVAFIHGDGKDDPLFKVLFQWMVFGLVIGFIIPNIDNWAHIGGMVGGLIIGFGWTKVRSIVAFSTPSKLAGLASILLVVFCLCYAVIGNWTDWQFVLMNRR